MHQTSLISSFGNSHQGWLKRNGRNWDLGAWAVASAVPATCCLEGVSAQALSLGIIICKMGCHAHSKHCEKEVRLGE